MKREKISLFILVAEIAIISLLHSAKTNQSKVKNSLTRENSAAVTYQLTPTLKLTSHP